MPVMSSFRSNVFPGSPKSAAAKNKHLVQVEALAALVMWLNLQSLGSFLRCVKEILGKASQCLNMKKFHPRTAGAPMSLLAWRQPPEADSVFRSALFSKNSVLPMKCWLRSVCQGCAYFHGLIDNQSGCTHSPGAGTCGHCNDIDTRRATREQTFQ